MAFSNGPDGWKQRRKRLLAFLRDHQDTVTTRELEALGFSSAGIHRLVHDDGLLVRHCRGVYRSSAAARALENTLRAELARTRNPRSALMRLSAAHHLGYLMWAPPKPQIVVPRKSGYRKDPLVERLARPNLSEPDVFAPRGIRCTTPYRTVLDLAEAAAKKHARPVDLRVFKRVIRAAANDDDRLAERWRNALKNRPFAGGEILSHELFDGFERTLDVRSDGEVDLVDLCREFGLPIPFTNVTVHGWPVDAYFPEHGVFAEVDTYGTHGNTVSFNRDRLRITGLGRYGLRPFPVTTDRIRYEPAAVAGELGATLALGEQQPPGTFAPE